MEKREPTADEGDPGDVIEFPSAPGPAAETGNGAGSPAPAAPVQFDEAVGGVGVGVGRGGDYVNQLVVASAVQRGGGAEGPGPPAGDFLRATCADRVLDSDGRVTALWINLRWNLSASRHQLSADDWIGLYPLGECLLYSFPLCPTVGSFLKLIDKVINKRDRECGAITLVEVGGSDRLRR